MPALKSLPSQARVDANRRNAQRSTGPKTEVGKSRSRGNAVKHGLAGAGIALPSEDDAAIRERFAALHAELAPRTVVGDYLVGRVALAMVRSDRAARHEAKAISYRMRHAAEDHDQARRDSAVLLRNHLQEDPRATRRDLLRTPEGVDLLVDHLYEIRKHVARLEPVWSAELETRLLNTCGWEADEFDPSRGLALSRALLGDDCFLDDHEIEQRAACPVPQHYVALVMRSLITAEIHRLAKHRATLDHDTIAQDRAEAAERALFDPGRDAELARRYEARASRELIQALDRLQIAEAADHPEPTTPPEPEPTTEPDSATVENFPTVEHIDGNDLIVAKSLPRNDLVPVLASFGTDASTAGSASFATAPGSLGERGA